MRRYVLQPSSFRRRARASAASILLIGALGLVGCGRGGFEPTGAEATPPDQLDPGDSDAGDEGGPDDGSGDPNPDPTRVVTPLSFASPDNACSENALGPFQQVGEIILPRTYGVWYQPPFLVAAHPGGAMNGALSTYEVTSDELTLIDRDVPGGFVEAIYFDGQYYYVGAPGRGLLVYAIDQNGQIALLGENTVELLQARRAWGDGTYVYVPIGTDGLRAIQFDGQSINLIGEPLPSTGFAQGAMVHDDGDIYFSDDNELRVLTFDGTSFTERASLTAGTGRAWSAMGVVFASSDGGVSAVLRNGNTVDVLARFETNGISVREVWSDGSLLYLAANDDGVYALDYDRSDPQFTQLGRFPTPVGGRSLGVTGNSEVLFVGFDEAGLAVLSGFACTAP
ncbi:MAG: hypothetical protein AAF735_06360 [Myxococcota bacterium]